MWFTHVREVSENQKAGAKKAAKKRKLQPTRLQEKIGMRSVGHVVNVIPQVKMLSFPGFCVMDAYFGGTKLVLVCLKITILSSGYAFHELLLYVPFFHLCTWKYYCLVT